MIRNLSPRDRRWVIGYLVFGLVFVGGGLVIGVGGERGAGICSMLAGMLVMLAGGYLALDARLAQLERLLLPPKPPVDLETQVVKVTAKKFDGEFN